MQKMHGPALWLVLALSTSAGEKPLHLAAPGLSYVNLDEKAGDAFLDYFNQQLALAGKIQVATKAEVSAVLGMERQRNLLGCSEQGSCMAELAGALGVDGIITGSLAR